MFFLAQYRKKRKKCIINGLKLEFKTILLSLWDRSIYALWQKKCFAMGKNSKSRPDNLIIYLWLTTARNFSHISLSYFPSEWFRTSLFFAVCDVLGLCIYIKKRKGCISLLNLIGNHETCYPYITALMFGWMAVRLD